MSPEAQVDFAELDKLLEEAVKEIVESKKEEKKEQTKEESVEPSCPDKKGVEASAPVQIETQPEESVARSSAHQPQIQPAPSSAQPTPSSQPQAVDFSQLDKLLESAVEEMISQKESGPLEKKIEQVKESEKQGESATPSPTLPTPTSQEGVKETKVEEKAVQKAEVSQQPSTPAPQPSFSLQSSSSQQVDFSQLEKMLDEAVKEMSGEGGEKKESETKAEAEKVVAKTEKVEESKGAEGEEEEQKLFNEEIGAGIVKFVIKGKEREFIRTGVPGFDDLFTHGIPKGNAVLVAGGAGSGKTILCLQICYNLSRAGLKTLFMSFEEKPERLVEHMKDFGMDPEPLMKKNMLKIELYNAFDISRSIEALLAKQRGELLIDVDPVILPENFIPDVVVVDSLSAIGSAFMGRMENYRIYIEQLFRFFEKLGITSFLITETEPMPTRFSLTGAEEFLADGVIVLYHLRKKDIRENAIEVLKMRGEKHVKKIVPMEITDTGIIVYPQQEAFGMKEFF